MLIAEGGPSKILLKIQNSWGIIRQETSLKKSKITVRDKLFKIVLKKSTAFKKILSKSTISVRDSPSKESLKNPRLFQTIVPEKNRQLLQRIVL